MKMKMITLLFFTFAIAVNSYGQNQNRIMIDSGHSDSIESIVYHNSGVLISTDNTGLVKIWDLATDSLKYDVNTGAEGSIQVKVNPVKTEFALLVSRPGYTELSAWNWETGKILFRKELQDRPIQFEYSGQGHYIFMTRISSPSITLMNSQTGREYSYLKRLFDLFSFGYIGSSESRVMTYSSSGIIKYWDIRTSALKSEAETLPSLTEIEVLQTEGKRYFTARKGNVLYLIDRLNGSVRDSLEIENLKDFAVDPEKGYLTVTTQTQTGRLEVKAYTTSGAFFTPMDLDILFTSRQTVLLTDTRPTTGLFTITGTLTGSLTAQNRIFLTDSNGTIWELDKETKKPVIFKKNNITDIKDLNFMADSLYILSSSQLIRLDSQGFNEPNLRSGIQSFSDINLTITDSPLQGDSEIEPVDNQKMIIWTKGSVQRGYIIYDPLQKQILNSNYNFESPINQIHVRNSQVLVLENSGEASLNNIFTGFRDFHFSALGMVSLNFLNDTTLIGGKSLMKTGRNPMFTVHTDTGEIIPIADDRFLIYDIFTPAGSNRSYSVGLKQTIGDKVETKIVSHNSQNPDSLTNMFSLEGEWINARFTADTSSYSPTLYGTISGRDIVRISGSRKRTWDYPKNIEKVFFKNGLLYIMNSDGSLTLFDPAQGKILLDFYLMADGSWIMIPGDKDEKIYISESEASSYLKTYNSLGRSIRNSYIIKK